MWAVNCLATALIFVAGISCFGTAEARTLNKNEKFLGVLKNECEKNGEPTAYDKVVEKLSHLSSCGDFLIDSSQFPSEIAHARSKGDLGSVFKMYCHQVPTFEACVKNVTESVEPCMDSETREEIHILFNMTSLFLEFMCHDDGNRVTTFVVNGGVECLVSEQESLQSCMNETFARYMMADDSDVSSLIVGQESCSDLQKFRDCSVDVFENCDDPTPATVVDSLFDHLLKASPCNKVLDVEASTPQPLEDLLVDIAKQKCDRNGGPTAYDSMYEDLSRLNDCVESVLRKVYLAHVKFTSDLRKPTSAELLRRYCNHVPQVEWCVNRFTDSAKLCLDPQEYKTVDILENVGKSVMEFLCDRRATAYADVVDAGGEECFYSKERALKNCSHQFFGSYFTPERLTKPLVLNIEDCINARNTQTCMMEVLSECENQKTADFFKSMTDAAFESTPCKKLSKLQTPSVTEIANHNFAERGNFTEWKPYSSFEEKCEINGGPMAYKIAAESMDYVSISMRPLTSTPKLGNMNTVAARSLVKDILCRRAPMFEELAQFLTNSIRPCLEMVEMDFLEIIDNVTSRTLEFFCENDGEHLLTLLNPDGEKCFGDHGENVLRCAREAFGFQSLNVSEEFPFLTTYDTPLILTTGDCTNLGKFKTCTIEALAECEQQTYSQLANSLLNLVEDATPCKNMLQTETSSSTELISSSTEQEEEEFGIDILLSLLPDESDWSVILDSLDKYLRNRCFENGGLVAYDAARGLPKYIQDGVIALQTSLYRLKADIKDASWGGRDRLDAIFFKYCDDVPAVEKFLKRIFDSLKPCLDQGSRKNLDILYNAIESSLYFMCDNDGERLADFVSTGGVKCIAENFENVGDCIAESLNPVIPSNGPFVLGVRECHAIETAQHCAMKVIEDCDSQTPATTISELFNLLFTESPCDDILKDEMLNSRYFRTLGQVVSRVVG